MLKCLRKINLSDDSLRKNDDFFQNYDFLRKAKSNLTKNQIYILRKSDALCMSLPKLANFDDTSIVAIEQFYPFFRIILLH